MIVGFKRTIKRGRFNRKGIADVVVTTTYLHSTKGFRLVDGTRRKGTTSSRDMPPFTETFVRSPRSARRDNGIGSIEITEKMLMRHGWYRRKLRNEKPDAECYP